MTLRPRLIVQATCAVWVCFMGLALYGSAIWTSYENLAVASNRDRGNGVQSGLELGGDGTLPSKSGGQEPPSLPGNPVGATAPNSGAILETPGFVRLPVSANHGLRETGPVIAQSDLRRMATSAANLCGVPVRLFHALIERESSWRPYVVSSSGAVGLAQVKPSTARGVSPGLDVRDPWQNLVAGACYLRQQRDRFGTWRLALYAYVAGPNRVRTTQAHRDYATDIIAGSAQ